MLRPQLAGAVAAVLVALSAVACSQKGPECQSIVKIINPAVDKMKAASSGKAGKSEDNIKAMDGIAQAAEGAAGELAKVQLTVPELQKFSTEYQAMARSIAGAAKEMTGAIKSIDEAAKGQEKAGKDLEAAISKWSAACAAAKDAKDLDACKHFAEGLKKMPDDPTKTGDVDKIIADLDKVAFNADDAKTAGKAVLGAMRANNKVMVDIKAAQGKAEASEKKMTDAESKEGKLVDDLNKFCQG